MLDIAGKIIDQQAGDFDPSEFQGRYEDALRAVIEEKKKGRPVRPAQDAERDEKVVDLMEALKRSLGTAAKPKAAKRNKPGGGRRRRPEPGGGACHERALEIAQHIVLAGKPPQSQRRSSATACRQARGQGQDPHSRVLSKHRRARNDWQQHRRRHPARADDHGGALESAFRPAQRRRRNAQHQAVRKNHGFMDEGKRAGAVIARVMRDPELAAHLLERPVTKADRSLWNSSLNKLMGVAAGERARQEE